MQLEYTLKQTNAATQKLAGAEGRVFTVVLSGDFLSYDDTSAKNRLYAAFCEKKPAVLEINAQKLGKWDSTLVVILYQLVEEARIRQISVDMNTLPNSLKQLIELAFTQNVKPPKLSLFKNPFLVRLGTWGIKTYASFLKGLHFSVEVAKSFGRFIGSAATMRKVDFLFALEECGPKAIMIVSLISFMVGLILAFVGAIQLKLFGAQIYVASLVAIGMTRIMGAIMVGIIMAGRTGASYAAAIGTMQVNEEVDALKTMGISTSDFLVLPRVMALTLTMPILTLLADAMGVIGGMAVGVILLDIPLQEYWKFSMLALNARHFWVGVFHGFVFGIIIALCGCYYGIYCGRNADSVGKATTQAVVSAIVWMIVATGIITWIFMELGI